MTTVNPEDMISCEEAAALLGVAEATLLSWRNQKRGPAYFKVGHFVKYRRTDLGEWLAAQRRGPAAAA
jgi:excisionase family DNA binding protein